LSLIAPPDVPYRAWSKTDWTIFEDALKGAGLDSSSLSSPGEVERAATAYQHSLNTAIDKSTPLLTVKSAKRVRPWWNKALERQGLHCKQLQHLAQQHRDDEDLQARARTARTQWRQTCRTAEQNFQVKYLRNLDTTSVWKALRHAHPTHTKAIPPLRDQPNDTPHISFHDKCRILRTALFPPPTSGDNIPPLQPSPVDLTSEHHPITPAEIHNAIAHCNLQSAAGPDKFPYMVIKHAHDTSPHLLPQLFNAIITTGCYPTLWKQANCVVIAKPVTVEVGAGGPKVLGWRVGRYRVQDI
jgi:hypothetical protein